MSCLFDKKNKNHIYLSNMFNIDKQDKYNIQADEVK